jgi:hypothetical protein
MSDVVKTKYSKVFNLIPHIDELPTDVYCCIKLKDTSKTITTCTYTSPQKYKAAWAELIQQHLDASCIRLSNSVVLPRWVNDYRQLNANTILDAFPLPHIDNILANCVKGKIWSMMDMTNPFFQTHVHPDDVHLITMTTPIGLYEWLAMLMRLKKLPSNSSTPYDSSTVPSDRHHLPCISR